MALELPPQRLRGHLGRGLGGEQGRLVGSVCGAEELARGFSARAHVGPAAVVGDLEALVLLGLLFATAVGHSGRWDT